MDEETKLETIEYITRELEVELTQEDKLKLGDKMSKIVQKINNLEAEKKEVVADYGKRIASRKQELTELSDQLKQGFTLEMVKCFWKNDTPAEGQKSLIRMDSMEVVQVAPMQLFDANIVDNGAPEDNAAPSENMTIDEKLIDSFNNPGGAAISDTPPDDVKMDDSYEVVDDEKQSGTFIQVEDIPDDEQSEKD